MPQDDDKQDDPKIARLRAALDAASDKPQSEPEAKARQASEKKKPTRTRKPRPTVHIDGDGNIVGDGNQIIHTPVVRVRRTITPPPDAVTPAQKLKLKEALYAWVDAHNTIKVRSRPLTHAAAWSRFYKTFRLTSYAELPAARFAEALTWLQQRRASIDTMKTAPKLDPGWRPRTIGAIHARCKSHFNGEKVYQPYAMKKFGVSSLADLTDEQLASVKTWLFHKKKQDD
jgi:hypothetical protein